MSCEHKQLLGSLEGKLDVLDKRIKGLIEEEHMVSVHHNVDCVETWACSGCGTLECTDFSCYGRHAKCPTAWKSSCLCDDKSDRLSLLLKQAEEKLELLKKQYDTVLEQHRSYCCIPVSRCMVCQKVMIEEELLLCSCTGMRDAGGSYTVYEPK